MATVYIAGKEVVRKEGESLSSAVKRAIEENRKEREDNYGSSVRTHSVTEHETTIINKYSSDPSRENVKSFQKRLKQEKK